MIAIVDYGMGNVASIYNMLDHLNIEAVITQHPDDIIHASHVILPGVGSFDHAMQRLTSLGLDLVLKEVVHKGTPLLGICLGMQLLGLSSEEGSLPGLGLIPFVNKRFNENQMDGLRIPHMGWNTVQVSVEDELTMKLLPASRFYFVHSFYAAEVQPNHQLLTTEYGISFTSAVKCNKVYGVQFHPEKSHDYGMALLQAFSEIH